VGPEAVVEAARFVQERGAGFLDAPFTGSKLAAEKRELVYYIGGEEAVFQRVKPILEATSKSLIRIGEIGQASTVKVVTNMISAVTAQTLAEALAITQKAGIAPEVLAAAIQQNACRSGVIELKLPKMAAGDYEPHFSLKHMFKDVQLGISLANTFELDVPATTVTAGVLFGGLNRGWGELDFSALYKTYAPAAGAEKPAALPAPVRPATSPAPVSPVARPAATPPTESSPASTPAPAPVGEEKMAKVVEVSPAKEHVFVPRAPIPAASPAPETTSNAKEEAPVVSGEDPTTPPINIVRRWFVSKPGS
jgi:hypothetical protein